MISRLALALFVLVGFVGDALAADKLKVVATIPDLAVLTEAIGGDRVEVKTLARPGQNLHAVRVKPSHLVAVKRADVFVQMGLSLEHGWVPGLIQTANNRSVLPGQDGFVSAGEGYEMIEVPIRFDRSVSADVHPMGNPHINISLGGGPHMAKRILDGLVLNDPAHADEYRARHAKWLAEYQKVRTRWDAIAAAVAKKNASACLYHQEFDYLLGEMGLELSAFLEPRPGLAPTPKHLVQVVEIIREREIPVVLTAPWSNNKNVARVAKTTGADVLELPVMARGSEKHATWIGMIDDVVCKLARAYGVDPEAAVNEAKVAAEKSKAGDDRS